MISFEIVGKYSYCESSASSYLKSKLKSSCQYDNCEFTCDKSEVKKVDALLFDSKGLEAELKSEEAQTNLLSLYRTTSQPWILWNDNETRTDSAIDQFVFNWTVSYKKESEASFGSFGSLLQSDMSNTEVIDRIRKNFKLRRKSSVSISNDCSNTGHNQFIVNLGFYQRVI